MKLTFFTFCLLPLVCFSQINTAEYYLDSDQSIIYFDSDWKIIIDKNEAEYYRIYRPGQNNSSNGVVTDYFKSGAIQNTIEKASSVDVNDNRKWIFEGESIVFYETGEKHIEYNYVNGEIEGLHKTYYKSGKIEVVKNYDKGVLEGDYNSFYESGAKFIHFKYLNGKNEGDWIAYHENGRTKQTKFYKNNEINGLLKTFYPNGKLDFIQVYEDGLKKKEESFFENGNLETSYEYDINGKTEASTFYYESGEIREKNLYDDEVLISNKVFFKNGKVSEDYEKRSYWNYFNKYGELIFESIWNKNKETWTNKKYPNGRHIVVNYNEELEEFVNDESISRRDAYWHDVDSWSGEIGNSDVLYTRFRTIDGIIQYKDREWTVKRINGEPTLDGPYIHYHENGEKKKEVSYLNGNKDGEERFYNKFGNLIDTILWKNGVKNNWSYDCSSGECEFVFASTFDSQEEAEDQGWAFYDDEEESGFIPNSPEAAKGTYYWENKEESGRGRFIELPISNGEDFQITATVNYWSGETDNDGFGIIAGWKDWDNYLRLMITGTGYYKADLVVKGIQLGMQKWEKMEGAEFYDSTVLNVVRVGESLYFSIDKKVVYDMEFASLIGEESGIFISGKQNVTYDNFKVVKSSYVSNYSEDPGDENYDSSINDWSGNGSGIILSKDGYLATNHHVIDDATDIEVEFMYNGSIKSFNAEIVRSDEINDLAILKINDSKFSGLSSIPYNFKTRSAEIGQEVFALGYPMALTVMGKDIKFTDGRVSAKSGFQGDITTYQTTTPIQPGNSGGPLFDTNGNLIAINSAIITADIAENVSYSIKTSYLQSLIDALPQEVKLPSSSLIASKPLTEQIKILSNYVVLIKVK
jgi:S1-C subfamily serine protease/antitoxin component YwqK of YwqJK toxin-antitoxin module